MSYKISLEFTLKRKSYSAPVFWNYRPHCGTPSLYETDFRRQCYIHFRLVPQPHLTWRCANTPLYLSIPPV